MKFRVMPIASEIANEVRRTMVSPFGGLPAFSSVATGYGPCRSCLKTFNEGKEDRIYLTYNPFDGVSELPLPGPIFIHTEECEKFSGNDFPQDLRRLPMIFEGFGNESNLVVSERVGVERLEDQADEILNTPQVEFIHIRNAEAGCFIARIENAE
jgi:hypothetical protein